MKKLLLIGTNTVHTYNYLELVKDYFDAVLVITNEKREGVDIPVEIVEFNLTLRNLIRTPKRIRKIIAEFKPTIIHIHQANSVAFFSNLALGKYPKIPCVLTTWGSDILLIPSQSFLLKQMVKYNLRKANAITSDSVFMADEIKRIQPLSRSILIANFGIGFTPPKQVEKEKIIYSNRLHKPLYRIDAIIEAYKKMKQHDSLQDWKLIIAAVGEETDKLKKIVGTEGIDGIEFVGWVDAKTNAQWYARSSFWVSIPMSDATSISLLEAMACGCIPVVSDLPANREWIEDTKNGSVVKDVTSDFLTDATQLDFKDAAGINALLIEEHGTKAANKAKFIALYDKLLN
ncbi:glycosyltransferase family 4 protein [Crocinitomicaceae bacterium CZZ-1]|uniref:Glycosyltransferase family 4 protein n=1 Tax=Taishania pollutisoli TaxID=2766479 RepID=A0A8J6PI16_9FLAO|nr:glycosyltransferase family 4 protein [Taishania pollutisoli]MBC9811954.1 glycosyltransferase family 4 protein [Taishania pollutisoli]